MGRLQMDKRSLMRFAKKMRDLDHAALDGAAEGLEDVAKIAMDMSQEQVPVSSSTLKNSKYIEDPKIEKWQRRVSIKLGYGGKADKRHPKTGQMASEYMVYVHEDLKAHHPTGKAKFLEDPIMEIPSELGPKIAVGVKNRFARVAIKR